MRLLRRKPRPIGIQNDLAQIRVGVRIALSLLSLLSLITQSVSVVQAAENPVFNYTHLQPSPFTLPAGRVVLGTAISLGVTDFFQIGTDILRFAYQVYNANAKVSIYDAPEFAFALTFEWQNYNFKNFSAQNPDLQVNSYQPGAITAYRLLRTVALFVGGSYNITQVTLPSSPDVSGYVHGVQIGSDLSWAYNPTKKRVGNVLSAGVTYDFTFNLFGFGVSHHWRGFHIGIHYYPNADSNRIYPIISGGAVVDL